MAKTIVVKQIGSPIRRPAKQRAKAGLKSKIEWAGWPARR